MAVMRTPRCSWGWLWAALLLGVFSCQGSNPSFSNPRPRSREAAGEQAGVPAAAAMSARLPIDSAGGEVEYRQCKITIPRGALTDSLFVEVSVPTEPPKDVIPDTAYQISPAGLELAREALLTITYADDAVPQDRQETDIVIVQQVNGVWVELANSLVHVHINAVEAPIRYLGLYALRLKAYDSRTMNVAPIASFEFSDQPFPGSLGKTEEEAKKEEEAAQAKAAETPPGGAGEQKPGGEGAAPGETGGEGGEAQPPGAAPPANPPAGSPPPASPQPETPLNSMVIERRVVGGPANNQALAGNGNAGGGAAGGGGATHGGEGSAAGNIAEGGPPAKAGGAAEEQKPPAKPPVEGMIYFDASKSADPDGTVTQYDWDFDADGIFDYSSHSSPYAQYSFRRNGDYSVVLKVTDNGRYPQSGYGTDVVTVRNPKNAKGALAANIAAYPPSGSSPLEVHFAATVTGGTAPYVYRWTFSDGSQSSLADPHTTYPKPGQHTIRFTVTDIQGEKLDGSLSVQASAPDTLAPPQARIVLDVSPYNSQGLAPYTARFRLSCDRATPPVTYRVSYGDEAPGKDAIKTTTNSLEHVYTNAGFYLFKVIATDAQLQTASSFATVHAYSAETARDFTPSAKGVGGDPFSFGHDMHIGFDYTQASPRTVRFTAQQTPKPLDKLAYRWDFGDGNFSTEIKPSHTYARDGVYEVRLSANDAVQVWRHRVWLPVSAQAAAVAIQRPPYAEGPAPLRLNFDAIVSHGEEPLRYAWSFGGARRTDASTFYVFHFPGEYEVGLDVMDRNNDTVHSPQTMVRVLSGGADYRIPLAVVEPVAGSTRAEIIDYNAAYPLPVSSPQVEGPVQLVDLAPDGQRVTMAGAEGMIVKRVGDGQAVLAFLPAAGQAVAIRALNLDAAYCTVESAGEAVTYLIRPSKDPVRVGTGYLLDASGDGGVVLLKPSQRAQAELVSVVSVDVQAVHAGNAQPLAKAFEAQLTEDGRRVFYIGADERLVSRTLATSKEEFLSGGDDRKTGLALAADGSAAGFVSVLGDRKDIILGRYTDEGAFRLASVTDQTKLFSENVALTADGKYMLLYGSRENLLSLLKSARGKAVSDDDVAPEAETEGEGAAKTPRRPAEHRERFGVIRIDLSGSPDEWSITKVNPRFIVECAAMFDCAGPF